MGIKTRLYIQLPYVIKLKEEKDYTFNFDFEKFTSFQIHLYCNDEKNEHYNINYDENNCQYIRVTAIYNLLDSSKFEKIKCFGETELEYAVNVPELERDIIFNEISNKINDLLLFLREETGMFWVENINIAADNYLNNNIVEYFFYSPEMVLRDSIKTSIKYSPFYSVVKSVKEIDDTIFDKFSPDKIVNDHVDFFVNKANICVYKKEFYNFIIYVSIAAEAFIRQYIGKIEPKDDIVFNKLASNNGDYLNLYYNILLKYLKGKSLKEIYESGYTQLKRAYKLRNAIMHQGNIDENALKEAGLKNLNIDECEKILSVFKETRNKIENL